MTGSALFDSVLAELSEVGDALQELNVAARAAVDPALLAVCEARIATLLGAGGTSEQQRSLSHAEAACLAFTEQFVVDVAGMDDATVDAVRAVLGDEGLVNLANALLVVEQRWRMQLMWAKVLS